MSARIGIDTHLGFRGFTAVSRPAADLVARLADYPPPDLSDVTKGAYTLDPAIRPLWPFVGRIAGPAVTVVVPQGSLNPIKFAMEQVRPGTSWLSTPAASWRLRSGAVTSARA